MLFISKDYEDGTYSITDLSGGTEERYLKSEIKQCIMQGKSITGVSKSGDVYKVFSSDEIRQMIIARIKLTDTRGYFRRRVV